jgi:hypothetical protein
MQKVTYNQQILLSKEIDELAGIISNSFTHEVKENARKIAFDYFNENTNADPDTIARASFYIALKEYKCDAEKSAKVLVTDGGKKNSWWLYIVPIIERCLKRK